MRLAHILVCHTTDPTKSIESIPHRNDALWYVFMHSPARDLEKKVEALIFSRNGNMFPYRSNRGLSRSWNDGIHLGIEARCDAFLLLNDDLHFFDGGYSEFVDTIAAVRELSRNVSYVTPLGLETGTSAHAGQVLPQQFACCAIFPETIGRVGYFDENFRPAYFEDIDFDRRAHLAGMSVHVHQKVLVEHERSGTNRKMSPEAKDESAKEFEENRRYFHRKWGKNSYWDHPFDDSSIGLIIPFEHRRAPYGSPRDRSVEED